MDPKIPWDDGPQLTPHQRRVIGGSIAEFELGERSEGRHLLGYAKRHAERTGDADYFTAMQLFIAEENGHARYLESCMKLEGMQRAEKTTADSIFRFARKLASLELSIRVLVSAEIIAQVYYRALRDATGSTVLRTICQRILKDEYHHIRFQCERLAILRRNRSSVTRWRRRMGDLALIRAAIAVVWFNHAPALKLGGYTLRRFSKEVMVKFERAQQIADTRRYVFDTVPAVAAV